MCTWCTYGGPGGARRGRAHLLAIVLCAYVEARPALVLGNPAHVAAAAVGTPHRPVEPNLATGDDKLHYSHGLVEIDEVAYITNKYSDYFIYINQTTYLIS